MDHSFFQVAAQKGMRAAGSQGADRAIWLGQLLQQFVVGRVLFHQAFRRRAAAAARLGALTLVTKAGGGSLWTSLWRCQRWPV